MSERIGFFICHCGINIAYRVRVEEVAAYAATFPGVIVAKDYLFMCSDPGQDLIEKEIKNQNLTHVVVASCSPRMHEKTFRACRPAAALRYAYIFRERQKVMAARRGSTVLVLLPHDIPESAELLEILLMGLNRLQKDARVLIKCHPNYTPQELKRAVGEQQWPERFEIYHGILADAIRGASVVISSTSGTIVEAAALGIPVIFVGRQTALNNNVLEDIETELIMECFTEKELMAAINKCFNLTIQEIEQYKALGERIIKWFFLPVTDDTMRPFLGDVSNNIVS